MNKRELPNGWVSTLLGDVTSIIAGQSPPSTTYNSDGVGLPFFQGKADFGETHPKVRYWCTEPTKLAKQDDILISVRAPVGPTNLADQECAIGRGLAAIRPFPGINPNFILYQLRSLESELASKGTGTTFAAITRSVLEEQRIRLAPKPEQDRIVAKIDELFTRLNRAEENLNKARQLLSAYQRVTLLAAVTGRLRSVEQGTYAPALSEGFDLANLNQQALPRGWAWMRLGQLLVNIDAGKNVRCVERPPRDGEFGIVKVSAVSWGEFLEHESKTLFPDATFDAKHRIASGDFLFSRANTQQLVGACVIVGDISKDLVLSDKILRFRFKEDVADWVLWVLRSLIGRGQIEAFASGNQQSMRNISQENIRKLSIPLPHETARKSILRRLFLIMQVVREMKNELDTRVTSVLALKQSILARAFRGELVPQRADDESAEKLSERIRVQRITRSTPPRARNGKRSVSA